MIFCIAVYGEHQYNYLCDNIETYVYKSTMCKNKKVQIDAGETPREGNMSNYTKQDVLRLAEEKDIRFIRLQFTDVLGILKNVTITRSRLERVIDEGCMFDGSSIDGFARIEESDMLLRPDINTFDVFPWSNPVGRTARLICDVYNTDGTPYESCPRHILKQQIERASELGFQFNIGPECEFFLFHTDENGLPTTVTNDVGGYFDMAPLDMGGGARRDMCLALEEMGFEIEASHHEVAEGQHEIGFKYGDALTVADEVMTFKIVVKRIAQNRNLHATFMPKPLYGVAGSGMHINMSLMTLDGKNAFCDMKDEIRLSNTAYNFLAGLMKHAKAMTAITNPTVNSYKRLVPGFEAPCYIAWSAKNRSPLVRVPSARGAATRIELRNPDPTTNPYLAFALVLAAGLEGYEKKYKPVPPVNKNIFEMSKTEKKRLKVESLPETLYEALLEFKEDAFVKKVLGEDLHEKYYRAKMIEWRSYCKTVHPWELKHYLTKY